MSDQGKRMQLQELKSALRTTRVVRFENGQVLGRKVFRELHEQIISERYGRVRGLAPAVAGRGSVPVLVS